MTCETNKTQSSKTKFYLVSIPITDKLVERTHIVGQRRNRTGSEPVGLRPGNATGKNDGPTKLLSSPIQQSSRPCHAICPDKRA